MIKSIADVDVSGKRVLVRVDFNVPQDDAGAITDPIRIDESLPTIKSIIERGGIAVLMSHLGRPKGERKPKYSLQPVADYLRTVLNTTVHFTDDCIGENVKRIKDNAQLGDVVLLENLRFHAEEEKNDDEFAKQLSAGSDIYCNDAFGTAHRAHASTAGVAKYFDVVCAGLLMQKELKWLGGALTDPKRPLVAVIGGSKISGKIDVISSLLDKCDSILIGGGMMFTFLKAMGNETGSSLVEEDKIDLARTLIEQAKSKNVKLMLPSDTVIADSFSNDAKKQTVGVGNIPQGWMGLDIGPETELAYAKIVQNAGTVIWNGPMGVFEMPSFAAGTKAIVKAMVNATRSGAITIIGGGDSAAAIAQFGQAANVTHVSTGGGASLEFLEGKTLPGVEALNR